MKPMIEIYLKYHKTERQQVKPQFMPTHIVTPRGNRKLSWDSRVLFSFSEFPTLTPRVIRNHMRDFCNGKSLVADLNKLIVKEAKENARKRTYSLFAGVAARLKNYCIYRRRTLPAYPSCAVSYSYNFL